MHLTNPVENRGPLSMTLQIPDRAHAALAAATACVALLTLPLAARAQSVEEFYRGKTITLTIGYSVGGGYDLYGRLVARHMAKYIPGKPTIVPQNMTGAGSFRAASFLYSAAPKDGSVI